jgi:transposase
MDATTIAIDLAKHHFEAVICAGGAITHQRLTRGQFERLLRKHPPTRLVMEACGTAHHWARTARAAGHEVRLIPPHYVSAYRRRDKTDRLDCVALLEADRAYGLPSVPVKSPDQQAVQHLHRVRQQWMRDRTAHLNTLRGLLREYGHDIPLGATKVIPAVYALLEDAENGLPFSLRPTLAALCEQVRALEARVTEIERELERQAAQDPVVVRLRSVPGIGLLTATACVASCGDVQGFDSGRKFASRIGLAPKEHSSGDRRRLGRISKRGDAYLRTLFVHGARSVLCHARRPTVTDPLLLWARQLEQRVGHNKAAVALANKLARIAWAVWHDDTEYQIRPRRAA